MAFDLLTRKQKARDWSCGGFGGDARRAMDAAPDYFVWWYTVKSVGLGVVAAGLAFMIGRASVKK
jgi:hypothetical protein